MMETTQATEPTEVVTEHHVARLLEHFHRCGVAMLPKSVVQPELADVTAAVSKAQPQRTASDLTAAIGRSLGGPASPGPTSTGTPTATNPRLSIPTAAVAQPILVSIDQPYPESPLPPEQRAQRLSQRAEDVSLCTRCELLCRSRKRTVYGEGSVTARVCFFGEGPGEQEDATGRPFVGRSGELLTKMIEACTLSRDQVYILNTVKCRPPGNRNPMPDELANCREYFEEQFRIIQPEYIVCLGLVAVQTLLNTTQSIGKLRGRFHRYHNSKVLATYHPSYLLRYPEVKREAWNDLKRLMADMGLNVPSPPRKS